MPDCSDYSHTKELIQWRLELEICRDIALVRADVARLPFGTGTIDAVHAGAALHCWPSPAAGVRATLHYGDHYVV